MTTLAHAPRAARITLTAAALTAALAFMSGCRTDSRAEPAAAGAAAQRAAEPAVAPAVEGRDQYELAREIAAAESLASDEQGERYGDIRARWLGKRYRWKVVRMAATCTRADACAVLPFDRNGADKDIHQGWMPRLDLTAETYAALAARCEGQALCPIEFEGTLSELVVSTEHLTRLAFRDVELPAAPAL